MDLPSAVLTLCGVILLLGMCARFHIKYDPSVAWGLTAIAVCAFPPLVLLRKRMVRHNALHVNNY